MTTIIINDETIEAATGETILAIARRHALLIGFLCDGRGMCQTCECYVHAGTEHLSPPNNIEQNWQTTEQLAQGYRLGCQATLLGPGPVRLITRAEDIWRKTGAVIAPPLDTRTGANLGELVQTLGGINQRFFQRFPLNIVNTLPQFAKMPPNLPGVQQYINDRRRITTRRLGRKRPGSSATPPTEEESGERGG